MVLTYIYHVVLAVGAGFRAKSAKRAFDFGCVIFLSLYHKKANLCEPTPADVVFINDASYSVGLANFQKTLRFIESVVKGLVIGPHETQIGLLTFEYNAKLEFHLNTFSDRQKILERVARTEYTQGYTYTNLALDFAREVSFTRENGMRSFAAQVAIVITDGQSTEPHETVVAAQKLRDQ
ncbi:collagen alpha-1(XII) chain, partial [Elysia marginata]